MLVFSKLCQTLIFAFWGLQNISNKLFRQVLTPEKPHNHVFGNLPKRVTKQKQTIKIIISLFPLFPYFPGLGGRRPGRSPLNLRLLSMFARDAFADSPENHEIHENQN